MVRMMMMTGLVVGAYVAGYNEITHVEVMEMVENSMTYVEGMMEYAERFREEANSVVETVTETVEEVL
ncbi:uncharacterized protein METZ01_LOCUS320483 [marine metagenome]|uniref:Uncharacterized protein n=1 Tax=marine metagenome TaxID=408172 RepID=A0A382P2L0_9ZZZZ